MRTKLRVDDLKRDLCRASFFAFLKEFWHQVIPEKPHWNFHIKYLCKRMQAVAERVFRGEAKKWDLVVNVPPGTSKSSIISIFFPAWVWTRMPTARVLGASYTHNLALDLSRKCRDVVMSDKYQSMYPNIKIRSDQSTKTYFVNTQGGMRLSVGSGGSPLGYHFHFLLVDDPINPQEAISDTVLKSTNDWIDRQISTRKIDARVTVMILVMQRLAQGDPAAEMLKKKKVSHVCLPATDEYDIVPAEMRKFYKDGLLDPVRLPHVVLDEWRERGDYFFSGQFGQNPVPLGGGVFKVDGIRTLRSGELPKMRKVVRYWDKAGTLDGGDWTVGAKLGVDDSMRVYVLDVVRVRLDSYRREKLMRGIAESDGVRVVIGIEQEPGSSGKESAEATARTLIGYTVKLNPVSGKGEKIIRWDPFSTQVNAGNVSIVDAPWNKEYLDELRFAPFGTHDDQIDASSGAFSLLLKGRTRVGGMQVSALKKTSEGGVSSRSTALQKDRIKQPQEIFRTGYGSSALAKKGK